MRNIHVLEMLNAGRIEELKKEVQDEIYQDSIKTKPGAKQRYSAMKKYFTYYKPIRTALQKPCRIEFNSKPYTAFTNTWSLVLTSEDTGEIELYDNENTNGNGKYPDVTRLVNFDDYNGEIDINTIIAEAKSNGYKLVKGEVDFYFKHLMLYDGSYYKLGLLDATFGIINDGQPSKVYKCKGNYKPLTIETSIGVCVIMPVRLEGNPEEDGKIIIRVD